MLKKLTLLVVLSLFLSASLFAQDKVLKPVVMDEPSAQTVVKSKDMGSPVTAANYVEVAEMPNAYGPAVPSVNPVAYDPTSDVIAVIYRHNKDGAGSGQLFWSYSTDGGATYTQSTTSVQSSFISSFTGRYPAMTLHNPENSSNVAQLWGAFAWPDLFTGGSFDDLGYGVTLGMTETGFSAIYTDPPMFSSRAPIWSDGTYIYWAADNQDDDNIYLFRTADFATLDVTAPWDYAGVPIGGAAVNGKVYAGFIAPFEAEIGAGGWEIGYSVSEDQGVTWSEEVVPDWTTLDATANFTGIWDFEPNDGNVISFAGDIQVDANGYVHLIVGLEDTTKFATNDGYAIVELFETADGWDSKVISGGLHNVQAWNVFGHALGSTPGIGQMGYSTFIATNEDRDVYVAQWIYSADPDTTADIFMAIREDGGEWSDPINLTETPEMNETGSHLAPMIKDNGDGTYAAYSAYYYETGNTGPYVDDIAPHTLYIAAVPLSVETSVERKDEVAYNFDLAQNYPNPFNPSTTIKYSVPELADVSIKIYDMLGKEVTTLVDAQQAQGVYEVTFDASNLASGMYIYTMKAGSYQSSKKMLLMK